MTQRPEYIKRQQLLATLDCTGMSLLEEITAKTNLLTDNKTPSPYEHHEPGNYHNEMQSKVADYFRDRQLDVFEDFEMVYFSDWQTEIAYIDIVIADPDYPNTLIAIEINSGTRHQRSSMNKINALAQWNIPTLYICSEKSISTTSLSEGQYIINQWGKGLSYVWNETYNDGTIDVYRYWQALQPLTNYEQQKKLYFSVQLDSFTPEKFSSVFPPKGGNSLPNGYTLIPQKLCGHCERIENGLYSYYLYDGKAN